MMSIQYYPQSENMNPVTQLAYATDDMAKLHNLIAFLVEVSPLLADPEEMGECAIDGYRQTVETCRQYAACIGEELNQLHEQMKAQEEAETETRPKLHAV